MELAKNMFDIVRITGQSAKIREAVEPYCKESILKVAFHGSMVLPTLNRICVMLQARDVYLIRTRKEPKRVVGLSWLSSIRYGSAEVHFLSDMAKGRPSDYTAVKTYFEALFRRYRYLDGLSLNTLYAHIPAFNTAVIQLTKALGFTEQGGIKDGTTDPKGNYSDIIMFTLNRKV